MWNWIVEKANLVWNWLCGCARATWRIMRRELKERKQNVTDLSSDDVKTFFKGEFKNFFLGGLSVCVKRRNSVPSFLRLVRVGSEECFEGSGVRPLTILSRWIHFLLAKVEGRTTNTGINLGFDLSQLNLI